MNAKMIQIRKIRNVSSLYYNNYCKVSKLRKNVPDARDAAKCHRKGKTLRMSQQYSVKYVSNFSILCPIWRIILKVVRITVVNSVAGKTTVIGSFTVCMRLGTTSIMTIHTITMSTFKLQILNKMEKHYLTVMESLTERLLYNNRKD